MNKFLIIILSLIGMQTFAQINFDHLYNTWIVVDKTMGDDSPLFKANEFQNYKLTRYRKNNTSSPVFLGKGASRIDFGTPFKVIDNTIAYNDRILLVEKLTEDEFVYTEQFLDVQPYSYLKYYCKNYDRLLDAEYKKNIETELLESNFVLTPHIMSTDFIKELFSKEIKNFTLKGTLTFDLKNKSITNFISENKNASVEDIQRINKSLNENFDAWNYSIVKKYKKIRVPYVLSTYYVPNGEKGFSRSVIHFNRSEFYDNVVSTNDIVSSEKNFQKAVEYYQKNDLKNAANFFQKAFQNNRYDLDAYYNFAAIEWALGNQELACEKWSFLIQEGQNYANTLYNSNCSKK